jgi:hypothetical protein
MELLYANNAESTLSADCLTAALAATIVPADAAKFPSPVVGQQYFKVTLTRKATGDKEIVHCTQRAANVFTIARAQEGTVALDFHAGDLVSLRPTRQSAELWSNGRRNLIINPNFEIAQQGPNNALTNAAVYGTIDGWGFKMNAVAAGIANQVDAQAQGFVGFNKCLKLGRTAGSALINPMSAPRRVRDRGLHRLPRRNGRPQLLREGGGQFLRGHPRGAHHRGTGVDQGLASMDAGTWPGYVRPLDTGVVITNAPKLYEFSVTLPTNFKQLGYQIFYNGVGVAGADDNVYITGLDFSKGRVAPPREYRPQPVELILCQRTWSQSYDLGNAPGAVGVPGLEFVPAGANIATGNDYAQIRFPVRMRAAPVVTYYGYQGSVNRVSDNAGVDLAANSAISSGTNARIGILRNSSGAPIAPTFGGFLVHWTADARLA